MVYFFVLLGCLDLWEAVIRLLLKSAKVSDTALSISLRNRSQRHTLYEEDYLVDTNSTDSGTNSTFLANNLTGMSGTSKQAKRQTLDEQQKTRAQLYAKSGDFVNYCKVLIEMNDWESALAFAPAVSMDYWHELCSKYALYLASPQADSLSSGGVGSTGGSSNGGGFASSSSVLGSAQSRVTASGGIDGTHSNVLTNNPERCTPYLLAAGLLPETVQHYLRQRDAESALVVAKMVKPLVLPAVKSRSRSNTSPAFGGGGGGSGGRTHRTTTGPGDGDESGVANVVDGVDTLGIDIGFDDDDDYASLTTMPGEYQGEFGDSTAAPAGLGPSGVLLSTAVTAYVADMCLDASHPILAAAQYIASGNVPVAMEVLVSVVTLLPCISRVSF